MPVLLPDSAGEEHLFNPFWAALAALTSTLNAPTGPACPPPPLLLQPGFFLFGQAANIPRLVAVPLLLGICTLAGPGGLAARSSRTCGVGFAASGVKRIAVASATGCSL